MASNAVNIALGISGDPAVLAGLSRVDPAAAAGDGGAIGALLNTLGTTINTWAAGPGKQLLDAAFKALFVGSGKDGDFGIIANALNSSVTNLQTWAAGPGHVAMMKAMGALLTEENVHQWLREVLIPPALTIGWNMGQDLGQGIWDGLKDFFGGTNQVVNGVPVSPGFGGGGGGSDGGRGGSQLNTQPSIRTNLLSTRGGGSGDGVPAIGSLTIQITNQGMTYEEGGQQMGRALYTELASLLGESGGGGGGMTTGPVM
jgi:hypothetical protein